MKKILIICGAILLAILLGLLGFGEYSIHQRNRFDASCRAWVDQNVPPILSTWSAKTLADHSSPELCREVAPAELDALFKKFSQLGALDNCHPAQGQCKTSATARELVGDYLIHAFFKNGDGIITVRVVKRDGRWQFRGFSVDSPLFMQ